MNAIALNHICKSFGSFAIQDLTLEVPEGTICGLVGENGAGKSTTIRLLFHTQIGVGNRLDGGRRRVKKYLWSFFRTAPAGQVRL